MRLVRFGDAGQEHPGVLLDDGRLVDVREVADDYDQRFFASGGVERVRRHVDAGGSGLTIVEGDPRLGAPVAKPYQVLCIGLNYRDHAIESGLEVPAEPVVFSKGPATVVGPDDEVLLPPDSTRTDWEVELAVVIGSTARYLASEAEAAEHIAGFAISNDVSEREYQLERGGQWIKGKSCETFNPLGPWLVTPDELDDPQDLRLTLDVNGTRRQDSSTSEMVFGVHHLIWYLSQFMVLEPGDVINTGTPAGVGLGLDPPVYLQEGDTMTLEIEGLGRQRQVARRATR
ncbi:MAG: fumarylacetoacetate hydrolase family protein [Nitriliruptoraceae bacterium]|nr:fumarylacetoacetate hydrolase family protein [Nitriliruptoraceae bacterium]